MDELYTRLLKAGYQHLVRPWFFRHGGGDPEAAHEAMISVLSSLPRPLLSLTGWIMDHKRNPVTVAGIEFPSRVGIAAGTDKDGLAARSWSRLGCGFVELGTVTPRPQPGNPAPRLYRLRDSEAVINRMGFNNRGAAALRDTLVAMGHRRGSNALGIPIGISIGKNKTTDLDQAHRDYEACVDAVADVADYLAINVSSPNTPGLRSLQSESSLLTVAKATVNRAGQVPVFVKFSPDMDPDHYLDAIRVCEDAGVKGIIATNTTLGRDGLTVTDQKWADQPGGLSGRPLTDKALAVVELIASHTDLPVIGVGGIMTPADGQRFFDAGATLLEVYTGVIYSGPALIYGLNTLTRP